MPNVVWAARAIRQLHEIVEYLAAESPDGAVAVHVAVLQAVERVGRWPMSSPWVGAVYARLESLLRRYRVAVVRPFLVFYVVAGDAIHMLNIQHGAQRLPSAEMLERLAATRDMTNRD